jgi:homoserine kinase
MNQVIRVPASIGNLGPGFDTLGLAVSMYLTVTVRRRIDDGRGRLIARYERPRRPAENAITRAFTLNPFRTAAPASIEVDVSSDIPERAGLGSSAAAALAGLKLRELVDGPSSNEEILTTACRLEKHPDNASAAMYGGLTSSSVAEDGTVMVARWHWPPSWKLVIATPQVQLTTDVSRRAIPRSIPLADVVFGLQRLALLLHAVQTRDGSRLAAALADHVHQPYREPLVPVLRRVLEARLPGTLGACLSGAGPSVVVIANGDTEAVAAGVRALYAKENVPCTVRVVRAAGWTRMWSGDRNLRTSTRPGTPARRGESDRKREAWENTAWSTARSPRS